MGFLEDIQTILMEVPEERQTLLFSATIPPAIQKIARDFQKDPKIVEVNNGQRTVDSIEQYFFQVPQARKNDMINLLLQYYNPKRSVVFCNTKRMVDELVVFLNHSGFRSIGLHGDMKQNVRTQVMNDFKAGRIQILVATDVCARGIDVEDIDAVFNYDIPQEFEYYIHRIGRTGRAGKTGKSYTLACNGKQVRTVKDIQRYVGADITQLPIPSSKDIVQHKQEKFMETIKEAVDAHNYSDWEYLVDRMVSEEYDLKDIACAAISIVAGKELKKVPDIKPMITARPEADRSSAVGRGTRVNLRVSLGRNQQVAPNHIVGAIVEETGLPAKAIGKINIYNDYTDVDMLEDDAHTVMEFMAGSRIRNKNVDFTITANPVAASTSRAPRSSNYGSFAPRDRRPSSTGGRPPRKTYGASA
ncbi:MAG: DEAD/DEAH box helicase, partial [Oscillospiraceae bacterium]